MKAGLRLFALIAMLALSAPALLFAQSREQKVSQVIRALEAIDFPIMRKLELQSAPARAKRELAQVGKRLELGSEWQPGNPYWDRAETLLKKDFEASANKPMDRVRKEESELRKALRELSDPQLDEVLRFYTSDLFRKSTRMVDTTMAALMFGITLAEEKSEADAIRLIENFKRDAERNKLTPEEERRLEKAMQSPAMQLLAREGRELIAAYTGPPLAAQASLTQATAKEAAGIITQFREAYKVLAPLPPDYDADFIADRKRERAYRENANAAMRGDKQALARIIAGAQNGDPIAQTELGRMYLIGRGVEKDDKAAYEWNARAAQQLFPRGLFNLGVHYENGIGVEPNLKDAAENYRRASEKGLARGQLALGLLYRTGKGVPQDFQRSLELIAAAAKQGLPAAELAMAEIFDAGAGVAPDEATANVWLDRALVQGYEPAAQYMRERDKRKTQLIALIRESPSSAKASATAVDKPELNRRLLDAVKKVNIEYVRALLDAGADIETRDERPNLGETPLHQAARTGNVDLAKVLVAKGANVNVTGPSGFIPLHVAAGLNRRAMAEYLIAAGANPNAMDDVGTPLHAATLQGHAAIVSLLLGKGADPNARRARDGYTPLHMLSQIGQYFPSHGDIIDALVRRGADINAKSTEGHTPLDHANKKAIAALITRGAVLSTAENFDLLRRVIYSGSREPLVYLEQRGFALTTKSKEGSSLLHIAAEQEDPSALNYLIEKRLDINAENNDGQTPLYAATGACRAANVGLLLKSGARVNHVSPNGTTALHAMLERSYIITWEICQKAIDLLLAAGADPRIRDKNGTTPLHVVADQRPLLEKMLKTGADPRARDTSGLTPLHTFGLYGKRPEAIDILVKAGGDPNAQDVGGRTPLHLFSIWGVTEERLATARALVRNGARIDVRDHEGQTALEAFAKTPWGQHPNEWADRPFMDLLKGTKP